MEVEINIIERVWEARDLIMQIAGMLVVAASVVVAGTSTPAPTSALGRIYKLIEWTSLNFGKAKDKGTPDPKVCQCDEFIDDTPAS
jgi:hypothetical protein